RLGPCSRAGFRRTLPGSTPTRPTCGRCASLPDVLIGESVECGVVVRRHFPGAREVLVGEQLGQAGDLAETQNLVSVHAKLLRDPLVGPVASLQLDDNLGHCIDAVLAASAVVAN